MDASTFHCDTINKHLLVAGASVRNETYNLTKLQAAAHWHGHYICKLRLPRSSGEDHLSDATSSRLHLVRAPFAMVVEHAPLLPGAVRTEPSSIGHFDYSHRERELSLICHAVVLRRPFVRAHNDGGHHRSLCDWTTEIAWLLGA